MEQSREEFLEQFGADYGYPDAPRGVDQMRAADFKRLQGTVYLDHAGAALYSEPQMADVVKDLASNVYGNPHSQSDSSMAATDQVTAARHQVLKYFNASPRDYKCIFTSGATAALKLVGECFPWSRESCYMYTMENHNSVLGIREYALSKGATALAVDIEEDKGLEKNHGSPSSDLFKISRHSNQRRAGDVLPQNCQNGSLSVISETNRNLFAFPSECNFSGQKFNLNLVKLIKEGNLVGLPSQQQQQGQWMVLIDAAKGCATEPPNLDVYPADFVVCSFYKIFGYPTGLGALIVKNEAASLLNKTYFSGGTVAASIADIDFVQKRKSIEQVLEDGTISFLSIASLQHGFKIIEMLTTSAIARHTSSLATYVRKKMLDMKHKNKKNVCIIYGQEASKVADLKTSPTITFNLKREDGTWFGYREVEKLASLSGIHLRTGCFCNPGACAKYLGLSHSDLVSNFEAGHVCWDDNDVINGKPTGAVRISFGYISTYQDAEEFLKFLQSSFLSKPIAFSNGHMLNMSTLNLVDNQSQQVVPDVRLQSIIIYPVKSCQGFSVQSWPLATGGLKYDREWLLQGSGGEILTQKKVPELGSIRTLINLELGKLFVESPKRKDKLQISLLENLTHLTAEMDVYGQRYKVESYDDKVNTWFSEAIGRHCTFMRCSSSKNSICTSTGKNGRLCRDTRSKLSFVNEGQLLLISEESVSDLNSRLSSSNGNGTQHVVVDAMRFRPNIVISGSTPYREDNWKRLHIGDAYFTSMGGCNRCQMINLHQNAGQVIKSKEPLATLASYRREKGKILFGILLNYEDGLDGEEETVAERWLQVGQEVHASTE
ncbi:molybdenum cofactor sulfurase isoform X1 [Hordeum vulgare subsp. vulgare]|uniref:Molybdenum cofactor sulfurase n=1 Tax=Hordeum vulgare subsp. vulgare TaxID=112509 RepID=M0VB88_HORVV|nr:molybdenum cofactor sulfurase isoform X1 [Hordeum vulgare subsp. vulgare]